jgi:hypothetical protein
MSTCSCGGVSIECPQGCGCVCANDDASDCTRWCEPIEIKLPDLIAAAPGSLVRIIKPAEGTEEAGARMLVGNAVLNPGVDDPRYAPTTALSGCLRDVALSSLAAILSALHTCTVSAPADRGGEKVSGSAAGTLEELAERYSLVLE